MTRDINDIFFFEKNKNGKYKTLQLKNCNLENIYLYLRSLGYRKTKIDKEIIYYKRNKGEIDLEVRFVDIRYKFSEVMSNAMFEFDNFPEDLEFITFINWYHHLSPLKEGNKCGEILYEDLTEDEIHQYMLKNNLKYKNSFLREELLAKFRVWNFKSCTDKVEAFGTKDYPFYYKSIDNGEYLIFFDAKKDAYCFDCLIAEFKNEKEIGVKHPISYSSIMNGFRLDRDFDLVKSYV